MVSKVETCVIICIFGKNFTVVYEAPKTYPSYCFTNNKTIQPELKKKGWKYIFIDFPLVDDIVESTLQVKYIKFLQFEKEKRFSFFSAYKYLIVVDHKQELKDEHISQIIEIKTNKVFLKHHPDKAKSILIWHEVERSIYQERYLRNMPDTINYINEKIKQGYSEYVCIPWCGLILYEHNDKRVKKLAEKIYNDIMRVKMPNDQIVWALVSQKYTSIIQMIDANDIPVKWELPG
ncbi:MAG: hypothetical protein LBB61_00890 [Treponema sp.]|jgi:hypothetical protein|nr:hypothetical protein [Treponema sp.]